MALESIILSKMHLIIGYMLIILAIIVIIFNVFAIFIEINFIVSKDFHKWAIKASIQSAIITTFLYILYISDII